MSYHLETPTDVKDAFTYNPETGEIVRNHWHVNHSPYSRILVPGLKTVFSLKGWITFRGTRYALHRLAWLLHYGEEPKGRVAFRNNDQFDHRIKNLYIVEKKQHRARIRVGKGFVDLGYFATAEECEAAKLFYKQCLTM